MADTLASRKQQTTVRLRAELLGTLKERAIRQHTSMNMLIESILLDAVMDEPNEETIAAINESRSGQFAGTIDLSSKEAFLKSMGL